MIFTVDTQFNREYFLSSTIDSARDGGVKGNEPLTGTKGPYITPVRGCPARHPDEEPMIRERAALHRIPGSGNQRCSVENARENKRQTRCEHNGIDGQFSWRVSANLVPHAQRCKREEDTAGSLFSTQRDSIVPCTETWNTGTLREYT